MPASTIAFSNLANGQVVTLPFEVAGTITSPNPATTHLLAASRQIDDNALRDISRSCNPSLGPAQGGPVTFNFEISNLECSNPNTFYMLTVYCWDDQNAAVNLASVTFKTGLGPTATTTGGGSGPGGLG